MGTGCFHVLATVNNPAMDLGVLQGFISVASLFQIKLSLSEPSRGAQGALFPDSEAGLPLPVSQRPASASPRGLPHLVPEGYLLFLPPPPWPLDQRIWPGTQMGTGIHLSLSTMLYLFSFLKLMNIQLEVWNVPHTLLFITSCD